MAEKYMIQCSNLWIVAPITRAVDDKTAKNLLGNSFKLQLKMDGTYSNVTFICTQTDCLKIGEAADALGKRKMIGELKRQQNRAIELKSSKNKLLTDLQEKLEAHGNAWDAIESNKEHWAPLKDRIARGEIVYPPTMTKRKRPGWQKRSLKNLARDDDAIDDDAETPDSSQPLTIASIDAKLKEFDTKQRAFDQAAENIESTLKQIHHEISQLDKEIESLNEKPAEICIEGRNEFSAARIKEDFAAGLKE